MTTQDWRTTAAAQMGLITRAQLRECGLDRFRVRNQITAGRWVERSTTVIGTTTGELSRAQLMWLGVLHAGGPSLVGDLTAAEVGGLKDWHRDGVTILLPDENAIDEDLPGIRFVRTRRPLRLFRAVGPGVPRCAIEPAVLHFAAYQPVRRTAQGLMAAVVQQDLSTPTDLVAWVDIMQPLRWAKMFKRTLSEIDGGAQSLAELDVGRMCRSCGLQPPSRQTRRRDAGGRLRFTDCEWRIGDGRILILEVDGSFHMAVEHWEDDLARQRALTAA